MTAAENMRLEAEVMEAAERLSELWGRAFEARGSEVKLFAVVVIGPGSEEGGFVDGCPCLLCRVHVHEALERVFNGTHRGAAH